MKYDPDWLYNYEDMVTTPVRAISQIKSGHRVFIGTGCGEPVELVSALTKRAGDLAGVELVQLITKGQAPYAEKRYAESFTINSFYIGSNVRDMIQDGMGSYSPVLMSDVPKLLDSGMLPIDVALIQVTPPDEKGKVSLGVSVDIVRSAADNASLVIAEVNPNMPWTHGDSLMDIYDIDLLVPVTGEILERDAPRIHQVSQKIAREVAALVPDGATLEFGLGRVPGVGRLPQIVMDFLHDKKDLGIHTEMISDGIIDLVKSGALNGKRKSVDRGKITCSFCMGSKELYDFVNDNPLFAFRPTDYVNNSAVIGKQKRMVAINMALEIDLTGQVCSDTVGGRFYSGIGGQVDFNRGASYAEHGLSIIVMPATRDDGSVSRIVATLHPGSGVVITRGTVHYVVTEYGVAYLYGKSIQERVMAMISIAHPDFREKLFREALEHKYIRTTMSEIGGRLSLPGEEYMNTTYLIKNGVEVNFRSIRPTDEPHIRDLVYDLSRETIYYRFMSQMRRFSSRQIQDFVFIDHRRDVAVVGTIPEAHGEKIIAVGRYYLNEKTNKAEVAFVIRDGWQGLGIGSFLFRHLITIAKRNGIAGFTAEVLRDNYKMQAIFNRSGYKVHSCLEEGVYSFDIEF